MGSGRIGIGRLGGTRLLELGFGREILVVKVLLTKTFIFYNSLEVTRKGRYQRSAGRTSILHITNNIILNKNKKFDV